MNEENERLFYDNKDGYEEDEEKSTYSLHMSLPFQG